MSFINKHLRRHDFITGKPGRIIIYGTAGEVIGFKSQTYLEPGYVFAPYIPMYLETEFQPRQGVASRYATRMINEEFYGRITVNEIYNGVQMPIVNKRFV